MRSFLLLTLFALTVSAVPLVDQLLIGATDILPEGLEYSNETGFLISSLAQAQVFSVNGSNGAVTQYTDATELTATAGLRFAGGFLYVANLIFPPNGSAPAQGGVAVFHQGTLEFYIDLTNVGAPGQPRLINDIVVLNPDDVYVTESLNGLIYHLNSSGATVWSSNDLYKGLQAPPDLPVGINGIDWVQGKNYLVAVRSGSGNQTALFKIPLDDPNNPILVNIADGLFLDRADGARFGSNGDLYVVGGAPVNKVYQVHSDDDFLNATIVATADVTNNGPTSLVVRDGQDGIEVYVVTAAGFTPGADTYIEYVDFSSGTTGTTGGDGTTGTTDGGDGTGTTDGGDGGDGGDGDSATMLRSFFF